MDVDYRPSEAVATCLLFQTWPDPVEAGALALHLPPAAPYEPGSFYRRELPCVQEMLRRVTAPIELVVIDGYVWLGAEGEPGLGAYLHEAHGIPVIGVAKTAYRGSTNAVPVLRGQSRKPLQVTAVGIDPAAAAQAIARMHGPHRIPTLLQRVDRLCRES